MLESALLAGFEKLVALGKQGVELSLLIGDAIGGAAFVSGAGISRGLLDELAQVVA
ncbi:protein of unknown function [Hyphomicrobium sp. 1Nfss2.1]